MLSFLHKLREKYHHGLVMYLVLDRLSRLGISINPYIIYREDCSSITECLPLELGVERVTLENCERLISGFASEQRISADDWILRLQEDKLALVMRVRDELVGYTWADLRNFAPYQRRTELGPRQAALMNTYIAKRFRGQGLAALIRHAMYRELLAQGRTELFSISDFLNTPAKNFKKHPGATPLEFRLSLQLFRHWHANVRLCALGATGRCSKGG